MCVIKVDPVIRINELIQLSRGNYAWKRFIRWTLTAPYLKRAFMMLTELNSIGDIDPEVYIDIRDT